jgi:hypothetical protein
MIPMRRFALPLVFLGSIVAAGSAHAGAWDQYLSKFGKNGAKCKGAIYGLDGTRWTSDAAGVAPKKGEMQYLIAGFSNPNSLRERGPTLNGVKYMATLVGSNSIIVKKNTGGGAFAKSKKAVAVCMYGADMQSGDANAAAQNLASYLSSKGY